MPKRSATGVKETSKRRRASAPASAPLNSTRMKKLPPSGSVEYWSDWMMLPP